MSYNFDITLRPYGDSATAGVVGIDSAKAYGFWEWDDGSEGGGLWLERDGDKLILIDYDGAFDLPKQVIASLRAHGVDASDSDSISFD